jgi:hypothetical protein
MNLFNAYKYLYYRIYSSNLRDWGEKQQPQFNAMLVVSFLIYLNIYVLLIGIEMVTGFSILEQVGFSKIEAIVGGTVIGIINYFIFLHKDKYKQIAKLFKKETEAEKKGRLVWCWVYVIFTLGCFFGSLLLLSLSLSK